MIIKRVKKRGFVIVDNKLARDKHLSLKAKGLMLFLLSLPDNWEIRISILKNQMLEGRDSISSGINELVKGGYVRKTKYRKENGQFAIEYIVTEFPEDLDRDGLAVTDKPTRINRHGSTVTENPKITTKTEEQIKDEEKTEKEKRSSSSDVRKQLESLGVEREMIDILTDDLIDDFQIDLIFVSLEKVIKKTIDGKINRPQAYAIKTVKNILNGAYVNLQKEKDKFEKKKRESEEKKKELVRKSNEEHRKKLAEVLGKGAENV